MKKDCIPKEVYNYCRIVYYKSKIDEAIVNLVNNSKEGISEADIVRKNGITINRTTIRSHLKKLTTKGDHTVFANETSWSWSTPISFYTKNKRKIYCSPDHKFIAMNKDLKRRFDMELKRF